MQLAVSRNIDKTEQTTIAIKVVYLVVEFPMYSN